MLIVSPVLLGTGKRFFAEGTPAFIVAGLMVLAGSVLGVAAVLIGLESTEWAFVIVFWFGIILAVPALVAVVLTRGSASDNAGSK